MKSIYRFLFVLFLALVLTVFFVACGLPDDVAQEIGQSLPELSSEQTPEEDLPALLPDDNRSFEEDSAADASSQNDAEILPENPPSQTSDSAVEKGSYYYDAEHVVLYLDTYGRLPDNYITKSEARSLGWEGGSVERYLDGAAIGGDHFGNYEGLLPESPGRSYTECDIDTDGQSGRGAKRLIFSNDGLYFYTEDHYESFTQLTVSEEHTVIWN